MERYRRGQITFILMMIRIKQLIRNLPKISTFIQQIFRQQIHKLCLTKQSLMQNFATLWLTVMQLEVESIIKLGDRIVILGLIILVLSLSEQMCLIVYQRVMELFTIILAITRHLMIAVMQMIEKIVLYQKNIASVSSMICQEEILEM